MDNTTSHLYTVDQFLDYVDAQAQLPGRTVCAVLGRPIHHSRSPVLHNGAANRLGLDGFSYVRVEAGTPEELGRLIGANNPCIGGFSVTMPGKDAALHLADRVTERAQRIGSANTLIPQPDGSWLADNTDVVGVHQCLEYIDQCRADNGGADNERADNRRVDNRRVDKDNGRGFSGTAIVVGNGGTARPAVAALAEQGVADIVVLARSDKALALEPLAQDYGVGFSWLRLDDPRVPTACASADVVVNTIPAPAVEPLIPAIMASGSVIDVIYDPYPTPLLLSARQHGVPHADGLRMLAGQAEEQFAMFSGHCAPDGAMLSMLVS